MTTEPAAGGRTAARAAIDAVARRLREGLSLAEIQRAALSVPWQRAVRVCATAGPFGSDLYEQVLRRYARPEPPDPGDPEPPDPSSLEPPDPGALAERGLLEPGPDPRTWRVPREDVTGWMREWRTGWSAAGAPPELVALEKALAAWYGRPDHGDPHEQLRHLLVADPPAAIELFERLFRAFDDARDYASCQDLLNVLDDPNRVSYAGPSVSQLRLDRAGYLRARLYWATDFSRSAQFLEPAGLRERADRLLSDEGPRVWQLFAPTGCGKTVQLRWLVARRCAALPADIPCARIDFDVIEPFALARYPWLLLLEVAEQLDRRFPHRTFERLDRYASYRSLAREQSSELTRAAALDLDARDAARIDQVVTAVFVRRLNDVAAGRSVLLVVDTLEEVLLGPGQPDRLLGLLARIVRECPSVRLVLAGRYDLRERAPAAMAGFEAVESVELGNFSRDDTERYLARIRGIDDPALAAAVFDRTAGHPFLVALFADLIEQDPDTRADDLREFREPALRLLIERVIKRIPDREVRWLVRYGVVPRRLHYRDVLDVLRPFLVQNRAGPTASDDPRKDRNHRAGDDVFPFGPVAADDASLAAVWHRLLDFAAGSSWVSQPPGAAETVIFHQNVRAPMRELIAPNPVFGELHRAFRRRFEERAQADPAGRIGHLREVTYHRAWSGDPDTVTFWDTQVRRRRDAGDLDGVSDLARELLGSDYLDPTGAPWRTVDGRPLLPEAAIVAAWVWLAYTKVEKARSVGAAASDPLWNDAALSLAHAAAARTAGTAVSPLEVALSVALLVDKTPDVALAQVESALPAASVDDRVDLLRVAADARAALHDPAADATYQAASDLAVTVGRPDQTEAIALAGARHAAARGRLDDAVRWCERAGPASPSIRLLQARLLLDRYEPVSALETLHELDEHDPARRAERDRLSAEAFLMLGRDVAALTALTSADAAAADLPAPSRYAHQAEAQQLRGVVLGELLEVDEAEDALLRAASLWSEIGCSDGNPTCAYLYCRLLLRDVGDVTAAARMVRQELPADPEVGQRWAALAEEVAAAQEQPLPPVTDPLAVAGLAPQAAARVIAARLAWSWERHRSLLPSLISALDRVEPPSARLGVLEELRRCTEANPEDVERLRPFFLPVGAAPRGEWPLHSSLLAELERLAGNRGAAELWLRAAEPRDQAASGRTLARWRRLQASARLQAHVWPPPDLPEVGTDHPMLEAADLLLRATWRPPGSWDPAAPAMLGRAHALAGQVNRPTRWASDIARALGEATGDGSLLAVADDLDRQLGVIRPRTRPAATGQVLADRVGEWPAALVRPAAAPEDLVDLQFKLVEDWVGLARGMGEVLAAAARRPDDRPELAALRLESDDPAVQALPWELALPPDQDAGSLPPWWRQVAYRSLPAATTRTDTEWVQRALATWGEKLEVDGVLGPRTTSVLDRLTPVTPGVTIPRELRAELAAALRPRVAPRQQLVVVVRPEQAVLSEVTSHADWGFDVGDQYASHGFAVRVVQGLTGELPGDPPTVIHISARLDQRGTGPLFDLAAIEREPRIAAKGRGEDLRPKDVVRWLRRCESGREPVVVLDPPFPGSPYDVPWQLVLRNLFAATLVAEGHVPVVIAAGVTRTGAQYVDDLALGLREGASVAEIAQRLRPPYLAETDTDLASVGWGRTADELAARATAVFAAPSAFTLPS